MIINILPDEKRIHQSSHIFFTRFEDAKREDSYRPSFVHLCEPDIQSFLTTFLREKGFEWKKKSWKRYLHEILSPVRPSDPFRYNRYLFKLLVWNLQSFFFKNRLFFRSKWVRWLGSLVEIGFVFSRFTWSLVGLLQTSFHAIMTYSFYRYKNIPRPRPPSHKFARLPDPR